MSERRSHEPAKLEEFVREHRGMRAGDNEETARFGDLIVIATRFEGTKNALELADLRNFAGKVVIDATNPLPLGFDNSAGVQHGW
jgi:predicted dinucleotide-binding enzyme